MASRKSKEPRAKVVEPFVIGDAAAESFDRGAKEALATWDAPSVSRALADPVPPMVGEPVLKPEPAAAPDTQSNMGDETPPGAGLRKAIEEFSECRAEPLPPETLPPRADIFGMNADMAKEIVAKTRPVSKNARMQAAREKARGK